MDTPDSKPAAKRSSRGLNFREKANARTMKEINDCIDRKLHLEAHTIYRDLMTICPGGKSADIAFPITTRGLGLNTAHILSSLRTKYAKFFRNNEISDFALYRVALAQLEHKLFLCGKDYRDAPYVFAMTNAPMTSDMQTAICACRQHFHLVASAINQVGIVKQQDSEYYPYVPALQPYSDKQSSSAMDIDKDPSTKKSRGGQKWRPDPYLVTLVNLRDTVESLSSPSTPQTDRHYFRRLCPIPGAEWNDDDILTNSDVIMPAMYSAVSLRTDIQLCSMFLQAISAKENTLIQQVSSESRGDVSMLVTVRFPNGKLTDFNTMDLFEVPNLDVYSRVKHLNSHDSVFALMLLMGERPPEDETWSYSNYRTWSVREANGAGYHWNDVDRAAMVQKII